MYQIDYTDNQWRVAILEMDLADWLRDWSLVQVDRTQAYYISRIAQLGMQGERVLDAGCGMGNWSMGLARHYRRVDAIEIDRARLDVLRAVSPNFEGRIVPEVASVHELPYEDGTFDGVFCNGVLFVTDYRKTLAEFRRVLKPGGQLYVTYCGMEWWKHLLIERGANEPDCVVYGSNGLVHYLWCLLDKIWKETAQVNAYHVEAVLYALWGLASPSTNRPWFLYKSKLLAGIRSGTLSHLNRDDFKPLFDSFRSYLSEKKCEGKLGATQVNVVRAIECLTLIGQYSPVEYLERVAKDVAARLIEGSPDYVMTIETWTFSPEEMAHELEARGFVNVLSGREGGLNEVGRAEMVSPIYQNTMGVFEVLTWKARLAEV